MVADVLWPVPCLCHFALTPTTDRAEHKEDEWSQQRSRMDEDMLNFVVLLSKMKGDVAGQLREIQAAVTLKSRDD